METLADYLVEFGDVIGYVVVGLIALILLGVIQLIRRRRDVQKARTAVRLVTYSICEPRQGPVAVSGTYHDAKDERWIQCGAQRVSLEQVEVVRGTRARWQRGTRTYELRDGDIVIAIGVMSRGDGASWRLAPSPDEAGVQLYATKPRPTPAPLWPWRAPLILAIVGGAAFFGLSKVSEVLIEKASCADKLSLQIAAALPRGHDAAVAKLTQCKP